MYPLLLSVRATNLAGRLSRLIIKINAECFTAKTAVEAANEIIYRETTARADSTNS